MSLKEYDKKRHFDVTPEPRPEEPHEDSARLIFVVQRHQASHLHFDFRLESEGVLKSWAVPKGPSLNPADKRLAVMVEDHPLEYASFSGTIPEGEYGAGTVEIWDSGTWEPTGKNPDPVAALEKGSMEFVLHGEKLRGLFSLIELKNSYTKNGWLLRKKEDEFAVQALYDANEH